MNRSIFFKFFLSWSWLLFFSGHETPVDTWELKTKKGNISIYTRTTPKSSIKEVRITTQIDGTLDQLLTVLDDVPNFKNWVYRCTHSDLLKKVSDDEYYYYNRTDFPFPLSDRDVIIHSKTWTVPGTNIVKTHADAYAKDDLYKVQKGIVRIQVLEYTWTFTPLDNGKVDIDYNILSEPGGVLPAWAINLAITKGPIETMERLKKEMAARY